MHLFTDLDGIMRLKTRGDVEEALDSCRKSRRSKHHHPQQRSARTSGSVSAAGLPAGNGKSVVEDSERAERKPPSEGKEVAIRLSWSGYSSTISMETVTGVEQLELLTSSALSLPG